MVALPRIRFSNRPSRRAWQFCIVLFLGLLASRGAPLEVRTDFQKTVEPILSQYCYDCHGDGESKGKVTLDQFKTQESLTAKPELWWAVLKNVRAGIMPPAKKPHPSAAEKHALETWIKYEAFGIDPNDPDPGRVTVRRLNRIEYRNTIHDLMDIDFRTDEEFPPDDTGYGFDNIGDVLSVSPLLLEKYLQAAETIVARAVPTIPRVLPTTDITGKQFKNLDKSTNGEVMSLYKAAVVSHSHYAPHSGDYRIMVDLSAKGAFDFDPGKCELTFKADDKELFRNEYKWDDGRKFHYEFPVKWEKGQHQLSFDLKPLVPIEEKKTFADIRIISVQVQGPTEPEIWPLTKNYDRFFTRDEPPLSNEERRAYAGELLAKFASKAFRRSIDRQTLGRFVSFAEKAYQQPGKRFEDGIARAMVAVLASPRFLFRIEQNSAGSTPAAHPLVDEYTLASRLSYFLWSTMPDQTLFDLAQHGELRKNLSAQVDRMVKDSRSNQLIENFTGQWLQARDVEGVSIDPRSVLARDAGNEKELKKQFEEFKARQAALAAEAATNRLNGTNRVKTAAAEQPRRKFFKPTVELDEPLRKAMRNETEMCFGYVLKEDRSALELIESDYTFLNERLAKHYGLTNLNVTGTEMRRVSLPADSPRGGVLTEGTVLMVTSNPTRTSLVKRGLFILDNIIGSSPPPPPADIPQLEQAEKEFKDREPTLREVLELHRNKPLCSSCHSRMDPLGFALENFNAMGMWRDKERGQPIDPVGTLITGESFKDIRELKHILVTDRHTDFYRCLTEKFLTYALGRGLEYYDVETVDTIVDRLEASKGRFSALLMGVIESSPFQRQRNQTIVADSRPHSSAAGAQAKLEP
jgi:hypothetical protein